MINNLHPSWHPYLAAESDKPYMQGLMSFLDDEYASHKIFPEQQNIFNAFNTTPFDDVKVVVLGQDPYHGDGQAHGLSFSVQKGVKIPPSLRNIYKELESDLSIQTPDHGCLTHWAEQGVLLLNDVLTVRAHEAGSHQKHGWEQFTSEAVKAINEHKENVVFLLWGSPARKKASMVNADKHHILHAPHPSPLSAHRGFLGCKHFSQANKYLVSCGQQPVQWNLLS